ncbi:hypothetical protein JR334_06175 [Clostridia bacterium]|nr:hypothetical protein JR334_06175 [Clostridia bacterium]
MHDNQGISEDDVRMIKHIDSLVPNQSNSDLLWELAEKATIVVAHRSLERLKMVSSIVEANRAYNWIKNTQIAEEKRMRALDVLAVWLKHERKECGESSLYQDGICLLKDCFFDKNPYFSKGTVVALGIAGGHSALDALFSLAVLPAGRLIRPELYEESIQVAAYGLDDFSEYLEKCKEENPRLKIYLASFQPEVKAAGKFTVYPANDYMALAVKAQGVNYKQFKYLVGER